jgi:hypothetical protein
MPKKTKRARKRKISDREFVKQFTKIVSSHLATLSTDEQDKRIRNATRTVANSCRACVSTKQGVHDTDRVALAARSRE